MTRDLLSLHRNEFLFDHPAGVKAALVQPADLSHYAPHALRDDFHQELSAFLDADPHALTLGHGAEDLLLKLLLHYRRFRSTLILPRLSWGEYLRMGESLEYEVVRSKMENVAAISLGIDLNDIASLLTSHNAQDCIVVLPTTNNPTGSRIAEFQLTHVLRAFPQTIFLLDAVYEPLPTLLFREFADHPNVHVIGSMSKFFGLPGLRLGFCSGKLPPAFAMALGHGSWQLELARAAMCDCAAYSQARAQMTATAQMLAGLTLTNITVFSSCAPFVLARLGGIPSDPLLPVGSREKVLRDLVDQCITRIGILPKIFIHENSLWLRFGLGPQPIGSKVEEFLKILDLALDARSSSGENFCINEASQGLRRVHSHPVTVSKKPI